MALTRLLTASAAAAALLLTLPAAPALAAAPPHVPTDPITDRRPCATGDARPWVHTERPTLSARVSDPDPAQGLTTTFRWRLLGADYTDTDLVTTTSGNPQVVTVPLPQLRDERSYAWSARTSDGVLTGGWSAECEFSIDTTAPNPPSSVTQPKPYLLMGVPAVVHISPPAVDAESVDAYAWTTDSGIGAWQAPTVAAQPGGGADLIVTPTATGLSTLRVWSREDTGLFSATPATLDFFVYREHPIPGPVGWWSFDLVGALGRDDSGHRNDLTLTGSAAQTPARGGSGTGLALPGAGDVARTAGPLTSPDPETGAPAPLDTTGSLTVQAWVRADDPGGDRTAVSLDGARTSAVTLGIRDGRWSFAMAAADEDTPAIDAAVSDAPAVAARWTHLVGIHDASTGALRLYVNGVEQAGAATHAGGFAATGPVTIGRGPRGDALAGAVDEVKIHGRVVPVADFASLSLPLAPATSASPESVPAGGSATITVDGRGDTNVVAFRYSRTGAAPYQTLIPDVPGGRASVTVTAADETSPMGFSFAAVDTLGRTSAFVSEGVGIRYPVDVWVEVYDEDFEPVTGATVRLGGVLTGLTGSDGTVTFAAVPPGVYDIMASKDGRCRAGNTITVGGVNEYQSVWFRDTVPCA